LSDRPLLSVLAAAILLSDKPVLFRRNNLRRGSCTTFVDTGRQRFAIDGRTHSLKGVTSERLDFVYQVAYNTLLQHFVYILQFSIRDCLVQRYISLYLLIDPSGVICAFDREHQLHTFWSGLVTGVRQLLVYFPKVSTRGLRP
jgi:hypothetical protein